MKKETAKKLMDLAYETRDVDALRRLCQVARVHTSSTAIGAAGYERILNDLVEETRRRA